MNISTLKKTLYILAAALSTNMSAATLAPDNVQAPVLVAVIDGGFDLMHPYLRPFVWSNPAEQSANGKDNDGNGFINDLHGWNFLGNADGENIVRTGTAEYRMWKSLRLRALAGETLTAAEQHCMDSLAQRMHLDLYILQAQHAIEQKAEGWELEARHLEQLNEDDDAHRRLGNHPDDFSVMTYGNQTLSVDDEDSFHGTMVMGLVAQTAQKLGADIRILPIRAIPDGDEYDRDVVAALKYAIDHGAKVINMSFGKKLSEHRALVDSLLDEAARHDILLVKASGNDAKNTDRYTFYPSPLTADGRRRENMLVVGAAGTDGRMLRLSNYGERTVDILAPGQDIRSTAPCDEWSVANGTSLSAPIVTGLAAAIRSACPHLTAAQVRDIIMKSSTPLDSTPIAAGLLDAERALELARATKPFRLDTLERHILNNYIDVTWLDDDDRQFFFRKKARNDDGTLRNEYYLGDTRKHRVARIDSVMHAPERSYRGWSGSRDYWKHYSADSLFYLYAYGHDLYLAHTERTDSGLTTRDTVRLTTDGEQFWSYAVGGNTMRGSRGRSSAEGCWIGSTHTYILVREDKRAVPTLTYVDNLAEPRPRAETMKYSMPGDTAVSHFDIYLFDADDLSITRLDVEAYPDQMIDVPRFRGITTCGNHAYLVRKSRPQDQIDLLRIDPETKSARVLIHEDCTPHLNEQLFNFHVLNDGRDILWWAERGDRGQWFLYDGDGHLRNAVTPADMVAAEIERIDTLGRTLILKGYGREREASNPAYAYYYRAGFNGKGFTLLTPGDGNHAIRLSPTGRYLVDHYSRIDYAGRYTLRDLKGQLVADLAEADVSALTARGWHPAQQIQVTAADGETPLYGVVYTPMNMQPGDRLPIISNPYPGPHTDQLPLDFTLDDNENQTLADEGFVVINYSYRGTNPWRGRRFYTHGYGNLRDYALDDDYTTIRQVAARIPQADTTRVGIYGHSGGGFMSTAAILTRPDFYKVAVAASGNHDNNIYLKWWGETFHGVHQQTDTLGHTRWEAHVPTTMELADRLRGRLLLIHGDVDNNVHPASTLRMAHALIRAGKHFDMLMIPGSDHGLGDRYYNTTVRAYFRQHLLGKETPVDLFTMDD
ncbi:MAG: prolyl oligopeptidase family serine peptidase [Bacteroidaceae bacterium]|nr:prolyl oligopeptidase family serine peptidase [Bacteroidaceae bacterium]